MKLNLLLSMLSTKHTNIHIIHGNHIREVCFSAEPDLTIEFQDFPLERLEFSILQQMKKNHLRPSR